MQYIIILFSLQEVNRMNCLKLPVFSGSFLFIQSEQAKSWPGSYAAGLSLCSCAKTSFLSLVRCFPRFDPLMQHGEKCGSHTVDGSAVKFHKLLDVIVDGPYIAL